MATDPIIDLIEQGIPPKKISDGISWTTLPVERREVLFTLAEESLREPYSHSLLAVLFYLTRDFPWDVLRVLALVVKSPATPYEKKITTLEDIRKRLDKLRESFTGSYGRDTEQIERYKFYEADYFAFHGMVLVEGNQVEEAIRLLTSAVSKYEVLGAIDRATLVKKKLEELLDVINKGRALYSIQALQDERDSLKQDIRRLETNKGLLHQELQQTQEKLARLQIEIKDTTKEATETGARLEQLRIDESQAISHCKQFKKQIQELASQADAVQAGLQFLLALPKMALAPLWVEVVRLAIQQGDMDQLTIQALQKLTISFPTQTAPLITQIIARIDDGLSTVSSSTPLIQAFQNISEVAALPEIERVKKAQQIVEAWDFILKQEESVLDA